MAESRAEVRPLRRASGARPTARPVHPDRRLRARPPGNRGDHARHRHRALDPRRQPAEARRGAARDRRASDADGSDLALAEAAIGDQPVIELMTDHGEVKVVPTPAGTRGYDDLRRGGEPRTARTRRAAVGRLDRRPRPYGLSTRPRAAPRRAEAASPARRARAQPQARHRTLGARASQATDPRLPDLAVSSAGRQPPAHPAGRRDVPRERPDVRAVAARGALDDHVRCRARARRDRWGRRRRRRRSGRRAGSRPAAGRSRRRARRAVALRRCRPAGRRPFAVHCVEVVDADVDTGLRERPAREHRAVAGRARRLAALHVLHRAAAIGRRPEVVA